MNAVLSEIAGRSDVGLELLFSKQWLESDGQLPGNAPLRDLPFRAFPQPENRTERLWKLTGWPKMDRYISDDTD
jgi:hypothetical protein